MLSHVGPCWDYVGHMFAIVGPCWSMLGLCSAYVGSMLGLHVVVAVRGCCCCC